MVKLRPSEIPNKAHDGHGDYCGRPETATPEKYIIL
jgi:hypothetical protein